MGENAYLCTRKPNTPSMYPLLFENERHELVWGTESWEVSAVEGCESVVANGPLAGRTLDSLAEEYGTTLLGTNAAVADEGRFPLLVKFIDAHDDLSIQVHPHDDLAWQRHHSCGKTEMWYVMHAAPGATLLSGFRQAITRDEYIRRVEDGTIVDVLARHEVHAGDVFYIPAGRVHSICGGIQVCEIQQSSDITYRLFDYHRLGLDGKPRKLHTELACDAIDYHVYPTYRTSYVPPRNAAVGVIDCPYFVVNVVATSSSLRRSLRDKGSFVVLSCLSGQARITDVNRQEVVLHEGTSCLLPAVVADFSVEALGSAEVRLLEAYSK